MNLPMRLYIHSSILGRENEAFFSLLQRAREQERRREAEWDRQRLQAARTQLLWERHQQRQDQVQRRDLDAVNAGLSQEQKAK